MNMMLHGVENPNIEWQDSLSDDNMDNGKYTKVFANPPFKGSIDISGLDRSVAHLTSSSTKKVNGKNVKTITGKSELLFLQLIIRGLKLGGRAAVIVPDGVLFGNTKNHNIIRKEIIDNQKLQAVISMPSGVFKPYAGVSTAVLIFTKTNSGGTDNVWFYDMQADGYSLDDKRNPIEANDIPDIVSRFQNLKAEAKRTRTDKSFMVSVKDIRDNKYDLSINRYKEVEYEVKTYEKPTVIIDQIENLDKERAALLKQLKLMLA
jgi:type I restriction enzyme M protein